MSVFVRRRRPVAAQGHQVSHCQCIHDWCLMYEHKMHAACRHIKQLRGTGATGFWYIQQRVGLKQPLNRAD